MSVQISIFNFSILKSINNINIILYVYNMKLRIKRFTIICKFY